MVREGLLQDARRPRGRVPEGHHEGVPQARPTAPSRHERRRHEGRGALQGDLFRLRRARRCRQAQGVRRGASPRPDGRRVRPRTGRGRGPAGLHVHGRRRRHQRPSRRSVRPRPSRRPRRRRRPGPAEGRRPRGRSHARVRGCRARHHDVAVSHQRRGVQHVRRKWGETGHPCDDVPGVPGPRRPRRQPGAVLAQLPLPELRRDGIRDRRPVPDVSRQRGRAT